MLQLSQSAATALAEAREEQDLPEDTGVRVSAESASEGEVALSLSFSDEPAEGDQVSEQEGTRLFVAPEVAGSLAESVIDIEETNQGSQLVVRPRDTGE